MWRRSVLQSWRFNRSLNNSHPAQYSKENSANLKYPNRKDWSKPSSARRKHNCQSLRETLCPLLVLLIQDCRKSENIIKILTKSRKCKASSKECNNGPRKNQLNSCLEPTPANTKCKQLQATKQSVIRTTRTLSWEAKTQRARSVQPPPTPWQCMLLNTSTKVSRAWRK